MAPNEWTYFDYYQSEQGEPKAIGGYLPLEKVYEYEPIPAELTPEQAKHVLGTQCQLWTEFIPTPEHMEYMAFPRLCAFSEVAWSPKEGKDWSDFQRRLQVHEKRLDLLGVNYRRRT